MLYKAMLAVLNGDGDILEALTGSARSGTPVDLAQWRSAPGLLTVLLGVGGGGRAKVDRMDRCGAASAVLAGVVQHRDWVRHGTTVNMEIQ